jgi:hypothetical protein
MGVHVLGARGGAGNGAGSGGNGGSITATAVKNLGTLGRLTIAAGHGNDAGLSGKQGGNGGAVMRTGITSASAIAHPVLISGGSGGNAGNVLHAHGGNAGVIGGASLALPTSDVCLGVAANPSIASGRASGASSVGGAAGAIHGITGTVKTLDAIAPDGGAGDLRGGAGGAVSGINLAKGSFVHLLAAGNGGDSSAKPGTGGSVTSVAVAGDIGSLTEAFNTAPNVSGMGGLFAGQGGKKAGIVQAALNGSVSGIRAAGIATILAGRHAANELTTANAVLRISGLNVTGAIGADAVQPAGFTFTDAGPAGFHLSDGDTVQDGLVIVRKGCFTGRHPAPLQLVEVV